MTGRYRGLTLVGDRKGGVVDLLKLSKVASEKVCRVRS